MTRPNVDRIHLETAHLWAQRSTCSHLNVGAVLARDARTIATGYNGAPAGQQHCQHHLETEYTRCTNTVHAEGNVLAFAARYGLATAGATLYSTHTPCKVCAGLLVNAGIVRVVYDGVYETDGLGKAGLDLMLASGVEIVRVGRSGL